VRRLLIFLGIGLAACGGQTADSADSNVAPIVAPDAQPSDRAPNDLEPGAVDVRTITMSDGTEITYTLILPNGFDAAQKYPVLLAMPSGGQGVELTVSLAESTYAPEALARGWVVLSPAAPDGTLFFQGSEQYIPEFLAAHAWIQPEGGRYHLAGISNGGRSAFRVAALNPDSYASMVVFPGFPESDEDRDALPDLAGIPFAMFVGGEDPGWRERMVETRDTLESLGAEVTFDVREGEGHIMASLSDGEDIFNFLDSVRG